MQMFLCPFLILLLLLNLVGAHLSLTDQDQLFSLKTYLVKEPCS